MKPEDFLICIPTKNRPYWVNEEVKHLPLMMHKLVVDGSEELSIEVRTFETIPNLVYRHDTKLPLPYARNLAWHWADQLKCKYIAQIADDTVITQPVDTLYSLAKLLDRHPELWVVGGLGQYSVSWWLKTHDSRPYYSTHASCAYCFVTRAWTTVRFRRLERSDVFFSLDCWKAGGRVALDPSCVVRDLNIQTGGCGNPRDASRYQRSAALLQEDYGDIPFIRIGKNGVVAVNFRQLGIKDRVIHDAV